MSNPDAAALMRNLPEQERTRLILWGVLAGKVLDGRRRFEKRRPSVRVNHDWDPA